MNIPRPNPPVNANTPSHARDLFEEADRSSRRARARLSRFFARYARDSR